MTALPRSERAFRVAFALLAVLACVPIWTVDYLPMVDLPQHAAQVSILRHWHEPGCDYPENYEVNWFTPYWLGYLAAYLLTWVVPVGIAFKILVCVILVAIPWFTLLLVRELEGDPWWVLLCFPVGFGSTLSWGFFSFFAALPLGLWLLRAALRYARDPRPARGWRLGLLLAGLFFAHVLVLCYTLAAVAGVVAAAAPRLRDLPRRLAPLLLALPLPVAWLVRTARLEPAAQAPVVSYWDLQRFEELPVFLTGLANYRGALIFSWALLLSLLVSGPIFSRRLARWLPFLVALGCVSLLPYYFLGTGLLYQRFTSLLLPTLLLALERPAAKTVAPWRRAQPALLAALMLALVPVRWAGIDREAAGLRELLRDMPPGGKLLYLDYDAWSEHSPDPVFLHYGCWYQVESCGRVEMSFAANFPSPVRFRAGRETTLPDGIDLVPERFDWRAHGGATFDWFLVRSQRRPTAEQVGRSPGIELVAQRERWWLLRNAPLGRTGTE